MGRILVGSVVSSPASQTSLWHRALVIRQKTGGENQDNFSRGCRRETVTATTDIRWKKERKKRSR